MLFSMHLRYLLHSPRLHAGGLQCPEAVSPPHGARTLPVSGVSLISWQSCVVITGELHEIVYIRGLLSSLHDPCYRPSVSNLEATGGATARLSAKINSADVQIIPLSGYAVRALRHS